MVLSNRANCQYSVDTVIDLSHDCSQIAYTSGHDENILCIYNIQVQKALQWKGNISWLLDIQFSPDGDQLWIVDNNFSGGGLYLKSLRIDGSWDRWSSPKGDCLKVKHLPSREDHLEDGWSWVNHFSSHGYHVKMDSGWVTSSRGSKLLWLPPVWRTENWKEVRWDGKFLALLGSHHPEPIIIEFQPQSILPHP
jgi:hypothetical protein